MVLETINITKIVNGGYGFAQLSTGQIILVRHALPNETVIITGEETKKNYLYGKIEQVVEAHPGRILPPCKYYGQCGGCDLQHSDYSTQLAIKMGILEDLLSRQNGQSLDNSIDMLKAPIPSPKTIGYRQRIRLKVSKQGIVGFHRFRSNEIIPIDVCLLAGDSINMAITALRKNEHAHKLCKLSTEVELQRNPQTDKIVCIFYYSRKVRPADVTAAKYFSNDVEEIERIFFAGDDFPINGPYASESQNDKEGPDNILTLLYPTITVCQKPVELSWEVGGFCQINLAQNKQLIELVGDFCMLSKTESVLDLYCGMGNFSIYLAMKAKTVLGIEGQGSAIRSAKKNAANADLSNTRFLKSSVHKACKELAEKGVQFDCVVIDPPRQGAPDLARHLAALTRKRLVYISCDPATLCRDLQALVGEGLCIKIIQPIDMFPQTHHIETVVLLEKVTE